MEDTRIAIDGDGKDRSFESGRVAEAVEAECTFVVEVETTGSAATLRLAGEFDGSNVAEGEAGFERALERSATGRVVFDLRELSFIDSTAIAFLATAIREHGEAISFRQSDSAQVRRVLALVGLDRLMTADHPGSDDGDAAEGDAERNRTRGAASSQRRLQDGGAQELKRAADNAANAARGIGEAVSRSVRPA
jgi:anti-anti-sigma factor